MLRKKCNPSLEALLQLAQGKSVYINIKFCSAPPEKCQAGMLRNAKFFCAKMESVNRPANHTIPVFKRFRADFYVRSDQEFCAKVSTCDA